MKKLFTLLLILGSVSIYSQTKDLPNAIMKGYTFSIKKDGTTTVFSNSKTGFDYSEKIKDNASLFEFDGHTFDGAIFFKGKLVDFEIYDKDKNQYSIRKCSKENCKLIHLIRKNEGLIQWFYGTHL